MTDYIDNIKFLISQKAGVELEEVKNEAFFEDDLNVGEMEINETIEAIEEAYEIDLSEINDGIETVGDLIGAVNEALA